MGTYNRSNSFTEEINEIKSELQNFKSVQFSGSDIYTNHTYQLTPNGVYDFSVGALEQTGALYKFIADKQVQPYAMMFMRYFSNPEMTNGVSPNTFDGGPFLDVRNAVNKELHYEYVIWNSNNFTVYGKVFIIATDTGVFSYDW